MLLVTMAKNWTKTSAGSPGDWKWKVQKLAWCVWKGLAVRATWEAGIPKTVEEGKMHRKKKKN